MLNPGIAIPDEVTDAVKDYGLYVLAGVVGVMVLALIAYQVVRKRRWNARKNRRERKRRRSQELPPIESSDNPLRTGMDEFSKSNPTSSPAVENNETSPGARSSSLEVPKSMYFRGTAASR